MRLTLLLHGLLLPTLSLGLAFIAFPRNVDAQYPTHRVDAVSPCGGQIGSTFDLQVLGSELEEVYELRFSHPGITAQVRTTEATEFVAAKPINASFSVSIAEDVPTGIYEVRAVGRYGISNPRRFDVDRVPEQIEVNGNRNRDNAMAMELNSIVNGRIDANQERYYRLSLKQGESILIECRTTSIDSRAKVAMKLYEPSGAEIARSRDPRGGDPIVHYTASSDQDILIGIRDFLYQGGNSHFYRLKVHDQPYIAYIWPPAIQSGTQGPIEVFGWNLPDGKPHPNAQLLGQPLEFAVVNVDAGSSDDSFASSFVDPRAFNHRFREIELADDQRRSNRVPLFESDLAITSEVEDETYLGVQSVTLPTEIVGRFDPVRDVDHFQFSAQKGQVIWIEVLSQQLGNSTDPEMLVKRVVTDDQGNVSYSDIAAIDDPGNRNGSIGSDFDLTSDDPSYRFVAPDDGEYLVIVKNLFSGRLDGRDFYRLRLRPETKDFAIVARPVLARPGNGNQVIVSSLALRRGEARLVELVVERQHGFDGVIRVLAKNLPEGVVCDPVVIPPTHSTGSLVFVAGDAAATAIQEIELVAQSEFNGQNMERAVPIGTAVWGTGNRTVQRPHFRMTDRLTLSVTEKDTSPLLLSDGLPLEDPQRRDSQIGKVYEMSRGGKVDLKLAVTRRNEFNAAFNLAQVGLPGEFGLGQVAVPENVAEVAFALQATNANVKPGWYVFRLQGDVKWSYQKNTEVIPAAQAELQRLTELLTQITTESTQAAEKVKPAEQALAESQEAVKTATAAQQTAQAELEAGTKVVADSEAALTAAQAELSEKPGDEAATQKVAVAEETLNQAKATLAELTAKLETAKTQLADATKAQADRDTELKQLQAMASEMTNKVNAVTGLKNAADQHVKNVTNAYKPFDLTERMTSNLFYVHVVASPIHVEVADADRVVGETFELPVKITRDYGFADVVEINAQLPGNFQNATPMKLTINADQDSGSLQIVTNENTPPGVYPVTVKATAKFNNVPVETTVAINLEVKQKSE